MQRRRLLAAVAAVAAGPLSAPAIGGTAKTLTFVPRATLTSIDPVTNFAMVTRNLGLMVYETLYARDEAMIARPQMVEADRVEDEGRRWTLCPRQPLLWHDGTKVLARDCVASLRRWMARDQGGATLAGRIDALEAPDDRTLVFRLNRRFPHLRTLLGRLNSPAIMVPERLAATGRRDFTAGRPTNGSRHCIRRTSTPTIRRSRRAFGRSGSNGVSTSSRICRWGGSCCPRRGGRRCPGS